jgi:hypothetical protein
VEIVEADLSSWYVHCVAAVWLARSKVPSRFVLEFDVARSPAT